MTEDKPKRRDKASKYLVIFVPIVILTIYVYFWFVSGVLPVDNRYPSGRPKEQGYVKRQGLSDYKRTGRWVTFHPDGTKSSEGMYEKGKKVGPWKYWAEDGSPITEEESLSTTQRAVEDPAT